MHHRVGTLFWIMIGVYVAIHACQLGLGSFRSPGTGFIFFLAASVLVILGSIDLARTFAGKSKAEIDKEKQFLWRNVRWQKVLIVLVILSAYIYFFSLIGFWISTFLLMIALFKWIEPTKWSVVIVSSLTTTLISFVIFKVLLEVQFPTGFLGF